MSADRHLLFGLLALQNEFISKKALIAAFGIWVADRRKSLDRILVEQSALTEDLRMLLEKLVDQHVQARGGDLHASLNSIGSNPVVRAELEQLADNDLQASIARLKQTDLHATIAVGQSTSQGTRFEIRRPLDRGGLGIVSVAVDRELNREVALKEIRSDCADDESFRQKFLLEAEVTGGLEHPNIVPVYGLGTYTDGRPYYAMRLIQGDNLREHIKRFHQEIQDRRTSFDGSALRKLLRRFLDICEAIDYAHARGILHRDLKPGNVMLGKYGETLVVDWGLAKTIQAESASREVDDSGKTTDRKEVPLIPSGSGQGITEMGSIVGTAAYAPPEQLSGRLQDVGVRSDVYGLGAILYELLTGQAPGTGSNLEETIRNVVSGKTVLPRTLSPQVPKSLQAICMKSISLEPKDRYASAGELRQEVERWLDDLPIQTYAEPISVRFMRWIRLHRTIASTATAVVMMSVVGLTLFSSLVGRSNFRLANLNRALDVKNVELVESNAREKEISGELELRRKELEKERLELQLHNAYLDCENGRSEFGLATMAQVLRSAVANQNAPIERRVRRLIAAWSSDRIFSFPVARSTKKLTLEFPFMSNFNSISQDGKYLAFSEMDEPQETTKVRLFVLSSKDDKEKNEASLKQIQEWNDPDLISNLEFLDESRSLVFADGKNLTLIDLLQQTTKLIPLPERLLSKTDALLHLKCHARGRLIAVGSGCIEELEIASGNWTPLNEEELAWGQPIAFAITRSGPLRIAVGSETGIFLFEPSAQVPLRKISNDAEIYSLDFSQDGSELFAGGARSKDSKNPTETGWYHGWSIASSSNGDDKNLNSKELFERRGSVGNVSLVRSVVRTPFILVASGSNFWSDAPSQLQLGSSSRDSLARSVTSSETDATVIASGAGVVGQGYFTTLAIGNDDGLALWRIGIRSRLLVEERFQGEITSGAFDRDGESMLIGLKPKGSATSSIEWLSRSDLTKLDATVMKRVGVIRAICYSKALGQFFWTGDWTGSFAVENRNLKLTLRTGRGQQHNSMALVNDEKELAFLVEEDSGWLGSNPVGRVEIVEVSSGKRLRKLNLEKRLIHGLAVGPSNSLITGCSDQTVRHWDPRTGMETGIVERYAAPVRLVVANETSPVFGVATTDGAFHIRWWRDPSKSRVVLQHESRIESACLSQDGSLVATGCDDGTLQLWDTQTGERIGPRMEHGSRVTTVCISPDARFLFSGAGEVGRIWEIPGAGDEAVDIVSARVAILTGISEASQGESVPLSESDRLQRISDTWSYPKKPFLWPESP